MDALDKVTVNKCCCCIPLKCGCYILGFYYLLTMIGYLLAGVVTVATSIDTLSNKTNVLPLCHPPEVLTGINYMFAVIGLVGMIVCAYFLFGLMMMSEDPTPVLVFMCLLLVDLVCVFISAIISLYTLKEKPLNKSKYPCPNRLMLYLSEMIVILINFYWLVCVNSYRVMG